MAARKAFGSVRLLTAAAASASEAYPSKSSVRTNATSAAAAASADIASGSAWGGSRSPARGVPNSVAVEPGTKSCALTPVPSRSAQSPSVYSSNAAFDAA